jgi:hypothetical protein
LISVVVEQQVIITKMRPAHMPVKVLRLEVKAKNICEESVERSGYVLDCSWLDI